MDPVIHFEMPYHDRKRLSAFYKSAFGWKMKDMGAAMGDYVLAHTAESTPEGLTKLPSTINGGFFPKEAQGPQHPSVVIGVADLAKAMAKVAKSGGTVLGEPMEIPGIGKYISFTDTEGNYVSLLQPAPMAKPSKPKKAASKKKAAGKKRK